MRDPGSPGVGHSAPNPPPSVLSVAIPLAPGRAPQVGSREPTAYAANYERPGGMVLTLADRPSFIAQRPPVSWPFTQSEV